MSTEEKDILTIPSKKNFDFIDSIRCLAMIGIVMEHSLYNGTYISECDDGQDSFHHVYITKLKRGGRTIE